MEIPEETLKVCYDLLLGSMDFGSGFWSTEELAHVRALGVALGAPPIYYSHDGCKNCIHEFSFHPENRNPICHGERTQRHRYYRTLLATKELTNNSDIDASESELNPQPCNCIGFELRGSSKEGWRARLPF